MKGSILLFVACLFIVQLSLAQKTFDYPLAPKDSTVDEYFGEEINDPYQWMENPEEPRLAEWLEEQQQITRKNDRKQIRREELLHQIATMYNKVERENRDTYIKEEKEKSKYEFRNNRKRYDRTPDLQYKLRDSKLNFMTLVKKKDFQRDKDENVIITGKSFSSTQDSVAIMMMRNGSDWREVFFFDLIKGEQIYDTLKYLRIGSRVIWHNGGVYYDRYDKPVEGRELLDAAKGQTLYYHKIGTSQKEDIRLLQNPDTSGATRFSYGKLDSSRFVFYHSYLTSTATYKAISYAKIENDQSFYLENFLVYPNSDSIWFNIEVVMGDTLLMRTNLNAPNGKVLLTDINQKNKLYEFIPEYDVNLRDLNKLGKNYIAGIYRSEGSFIALIFDRKGALVTKINFPEGKKVKYFYEYNDDVEYTNFCLSSFYHPDLWYQLSLKDLTFEPAQTVFVPYKLNELETQYIKYKSKDGTEVPMYITKRKDSKLDGKNPTIIYGYGGYGHTVEPRFNQSLTLWLLHGGILAIPNIRGGGAEGEAWGKAGRGLKKQNAIDDFIVAAEYLIDQNYTNPQKIAINGGSHGGMLVGAAMTQRPDLYKAVIAEAGVYDMLRFNQFTIGTASTNINEFGLPTDTLGYQNLKSYSPLHKIEEGVKYPNVLLITGDSDDRVPPLHSFKFLATLQEKGSPESLYHVYITSGAGHGGALTGEDFKNQLLYKYYFLFDELGVKFW